MTLWFVFALMTAAAIFAVLWPLGRGASATGRRQRGRGLPGPARRDRSRCRCRPDRRAGGRGRAGRDRRAGCSRPRTRERDVPARVEPRSAPRGRDRGAGRDCRSRRRRSISRSVRRSLPDLPLASRARHGRPPTKPLDNLVAQVEAHLEKNPTDGRGWTVLAPVLAQLGRYDDAARAYRNAITYAGDTAERRADLGEALRRPPTASSRRRPRPNSNARVARTPTTAKAQLFPRPCRRAGRPQGRRRDDLARACSPSARRRAVARRVQAALARVGGAATPALSRTRWPPRAT